MRMAWYRAGLFLVLFGNSMAMGRDYTPEECPIVGNLGTRIYHVPGDPNYREMLQENQAKKKDNRVCFKSPAEAEKSGYRRSRSGKSK